MRRLRIEFRAIGAGESRLVASILDDGELHAETNAEIRNAVFARVPDRVDLALDPTFAEPTRHQNRIHSAETANPVALDHLRVDIMNLHLAPRVNAGVRQRFGQRLVRFGQVDIFADHRDVHFVLWMHQGIDQLTPIGEVRRPGAQRQLAADDFIQSFRV